jgi:predicted nucleic acid-binding protein
MGIEALRAAIPAARLLLLDSPVFSYHLADHPRYAELTTTILQMVESGAVSALTTTITLAEVLTLPAQSGNDDALLEYELFLTHFPNLQIVPLDTELARETARVRGQTRLRTPDAVQIAAARLHGVDAIVTNDHAWRKRLDSPAILLLDDFLG